MALVAALVGGAVAGAVVHETSSGASSTTTVRELAQTGQSPEEQATRPGKSVNQIYREAAPGVVSVIATTSVGNTGFFGSPQTEQAQGSGFVIDTNGDIITNEHVIQGAKSIRVSFSNRDNVPARLIGADASTDVAVLRVSLPSNALHPIPLGDSNAIRVGDPVVAIGNPFGLDRTVTSGIISAVQREITSPNGYPVDGAIQTDAAINHGNSGGPLLNADGAVIGINAQLPANSGVDANVGVGFAIPIDLAKTVAHRLIDGVKVTHPYLGIVGQTIDGTLAANARVPADHGVLVSSVAAGSPAAQAGLKAGSSPAVLNGTTYCLGGDAIVSVDGSTVTSFDQLRQLLQPMQAGAHITLGVVHADGSKATLKVTLGNWSSRAAQAGGSCGG